MAGASGHRPCFPLEGNRVFQAGHDGKQGYLIPFSCACVVRQPACVVPVQEIVDACRNFLLVPAVLEFEPGREVQPDISRHLVVVDPGIEFNVDGTRDETIMGP